MVDAAIGRADAKELRNRALPARLMVYFVIAMWLWSTSGYVRVLRQLLAGLRWAAGNGERIAVPYDGSIAKARARLGDLVMADLFTGCAGPVGRVGDAEVFFEGLRVCAIDGSVLDTKPTPENLAAFGVPAGVCYRRSGWSRSPSAARSHCWGPSSTRSVSASGS
ncbi:MAG: transposase domain-containing protein [Micromonosporaceae bacterium]